MPWNMQKKGKICGLAKCKKDLEIPDPITLEKLEPIMFKKIQTIIWKIQKKFGKIYRMYCQIRRINPWWFVKKEYF